MQMPHTAFQDYHQLTISTVNQLVSGLSAHPQHKVGRNFSKLSTKLSESLLAQRDGSVAASPTSAPPRPSWREILPSLGDRSRSGLADSARRLATRTKTRASAPRRLGPHPAPAFRACAPRRSRRSYAIRRRPDIVIVLGPSKCSSLSQQTFFIVTSSLSPANILSPPASRVDAAFFEPAPIRPGVSPANLFKSTEALKATR